MGQMTNKAHLTPNRLWQTYTRSVYGHTWVSIGQFDEKPLIVLGGVLFNQPCLLENHSYTPQRGVSEGRKTRLENERWKSEMAEGLKGGDATALQAVAALRESSSNKKQGR